MEVVLCVSTTLHDFFLPAEGRKCWAAGAGAADEDWEAGVVSLAKCVLAMSNKRAINSTGFKGGPPCGAKAVFIRFIRSLNAIIEPALRNVSCRVKRGPPPLGYFALGVAIGSVTERYAQQAARNAKVSTARATSRAVLAKKSSPGWSGCLNAAFFVPVCANDNWIVCLARPFYTRTSRLKSLVWLLDWTRDSQIHVCWWRTGGCASRHPIKSSIHIHSPILNRRSYLYCRYSTNTSGWKQKEGMRKKRVSGIECGSITGMPVHKPLSHKSQTIISSK